MSNMEAPWHSHEDSDELFFVINGKLLIDTADETHEVNKSQLIVVPAGVRHRARATDTVTMIVMDGF